MRLGFTQEAGYNRAGNPKLSEVSETMLMVLYIQAMQAQRPDVLIKDEKAEEIVNRMRYDFNWTKRVPMSEVHKVTILHLQWKDNRPIFRCST